MADGLPWANFPRQQLQTPSTESKRAEPEEERLRRSLSPLTSSVRSSAMSRSTLQRLSRPLGVLRLVQPRGMRLRRSPAGG